MTDRPRVGSASRIIGGALLAAAAVFGATVGPAVVPTPAHAAPAPAAPAPAGPAAATYQERVAVQPHEQLARLDAEQAWQHSTGDGVTVAVLDSGVDAAHPDLAGRVQVGEDFVDGSTDGRVDPVGHGTTVASLIAGHGGDAAIGLAPDATILPVRVLDDDNRYQTATTVAEGVIWAVEQGAQVINLSLGGDGYSPTLSDALGFAMANDVVVIACTGNVTGDRDAQVWYPAREPGVVAVAGLDTADGSLAGWSESLTGPETVLAAPAVVTGAQAGGGHRAVQGTSFSSALVAGAAALIRARWPEMPAGEVVNRLVATAEDLGPTGRDPVYGYGALDPVAALTDSVPRVATNPLDTKARHATAGFGAAPSQAPEVETPGPAGELSAELAPGNPAGGAGTEVAATVRDRPLLSWPLAAALATLLSLVALLAALSRRKPDRGRPPQTKAGANVG